METRFVFGVILSIELSFLIGLQGLKVKMNVVSGNENKTHGKFKRGTMNAIADFVELTKCTTFVDKTLMIEDFFKNSKPYEYNLITCPAKFGKSTNLDMMRKFVESVVYEGANSMMRKYDPTTEAFFRKLKIWPFMKKANELYNENFQQYHIIHMTFKVAPARTFREMLDGIHLNFKTCYQHHLGLYNLLKKKSKMNKVMERILWERMRIEDDVVDGIPELAQLLNKHYPSSKIFLFIDDYDDPIIKAIEHNFDVYKVKNLLNRVYRKLFDIDSRCVQHALITGTLNIFGEDFPAVKHWSFLDNHHFTKYFGLTEEEVDGVLDKHQLDAHDKRLVKSYYGAYHDPFSSTRIYNPYSVAKYLCNRNPDDAGDKLKNYWAQLCPVANITVSLKNHQAEDVLSDLTSSHKITFSLEEKWVLEDLLELQKIRYEVAPLRSRQIDLILSYLFYHGFLSHASSRGNRDDFKVVSDEVKNVLMDQVNVAEADGEALDVSDMRKKLRVDS